MNIKAKVPTFLALKVFLAQGHNTFFNAISAKRQITWQTKETKGEQTASNKRQQKRNYHPLL